MDRDDVDDLAGVADDADAAVDELLLDRVVQDDLRGPGLREGKRDGVDAVVAGRVPYVPERGPLPYILSFSPPIMTYLLSVQRSFMYPSARKVPFSKSRSSDRTARLMSMRVLGTKCHGNE